MTLSERRPSALHRPQQYSRIAGVAAWDAPAARSRRRIPLPTVASTSSSRSARQMSVNVPLRREQMCSARAPTSRAYQAAAPCATRRACIRRGRCSSRIVEWRVHHAHRPRCPARDPAAANADAHRRRRRARPTPRLQTVEIRRCHAANARRAAAIDLDQRQRRRPATARDSAIPAAPTPAPRSTT